MPLWSELIAIPGEAGGGGVTALGGAGGGEAVGHAALHLLVGGVVEVLGVGLIVDAGDQGGGAVESGFHAVVVAFDGVAAGVTTVQPRQEPR